MGIHDRDYYRDESNRWGSASEHRGVILIIAVTVACTIASWVVTDRREVPLPNGDVRFVAEPVLERAMEFRYTAVIPDAQVWRVVTSFLLDTRNLLWLVFGMLFFYFFGGEMEVLYGTRRFLTLYLLSGLLGNLAKLGLGAAGVGTFTASHGTDAPIFATLVLFAFHYPHRPISFWLVRVPVWLLVTLYLGVRVLAFVGVVNSGNADLLPVVIDPLVGAVVGWVYFRTRGGIFGFVEAIFGAARGARRRSPASLRVYDQDESPKPVARSSSPPPAPAPVPQHAGGVDEHLEAKLDAVLAKVARHGKGSLTAEENDILMRASEVFKKKRR
jgi:membrane associated rhomboid family serine protease